MISIPLLALALFVSVATAQKCGVETNVISVSGIGRRSVPTSIAVVNLGITVQGKTAAGVQATVAAQSNKLVNFLKFRKVDKLTTTGVRLNPRFNFSNGQQNIIGYTGSNSVSFEVPVADAGAVLDGAVTNGATRISSVRFKPTGAVSQAGRKAALKDAVDAAYMEAKTVAMAAGLSLGRAVRINIQDTFTPPARDTQAFPQSVSIDTRRAAPTPIISGDATINARVSITYSTSAAPAPAGTGLATKI